MHRPFARRVLRAALLTPAAGAFAVLSWAAHAQDISAAFAGRLVAQERPGTPNSAGWGADILRALADNNLPANRENVCAIVAVASQESGMKANPAVPGLGKIATSALKKKFDSVPILGSKALDYLENAPDPKNSFMKRVRAAKTERDLDLAYRDLVKYGASRAALDGVLNAGLLDRFVEEYNQINTVGSMQVSVAFALDAERGESWRPLTHAETTAVRDRLYTRRGGLYYGARQLLKYETGYNQKILRFADYNAGRYAARNAAFQDMIFRLTGRKIARDGDLLSYDKRGKALGAVTKSEEILRYLMQRYKTGIDDAALRRDLEREKKLDFTQTETYRTVRSLFTRVFHSEPAFAALPGIELKSAKIKSKMTTAIFADRVNRRYIQCMTFDAPPPAAAPGPQQGPPFWDPRYWRD